MKKFNNKYTAVLVLLTMSLSSCLKDDTIIGPDAPGALKNIIELKNQSAIKSGATAPYAMYIPFTLEPTSTSNEFEVAVQYAGAETAPSDITVNLATDAAAITTYNAKEGTALAQIAATSYSFPASVVIPKGQREAKFKITVKPNTFDATKENALALKITSASTGTISGNFGTAIYSMPLKSIWQGLYTVHINNNYGTIDPNIGDFVEEDVPFATVGPNKLQSTYVNRTYSGWVQYQFSGDNSTISGITVFASPSIRVSSIEGVDLVDPVNKKFTIRFTWLGRGVTETWTRTGDLP
ncbi:DUF1735 domain-containing protein [Pedobacter sp. UBA4863]|uniref:DUF1735 domain-containing protein n=1 Tax=Pedobacter sp. UBA4863 TaxID=1947060 RepID=UPI0025F1625A|nr:DUF1735 domain-containing protein [Pedobacter sp. UBA4863]